MIVTIHYNNKSQSVKIPESYEALTVSQFQAIAPHILGFRLNHTQSVIALISVLLSLEVGRKVALNKEDADTFILIKRALGFLKSAGCVYAPFEFFKHNNIKYYLPVTGLGNINFGEFYWLMQYLNQYHSTQNIEFAKRMILVICRKHRENYCATSLEYDKREPFTPEIGEALTIKNKDIFNDLPENIIIVIIEYIIQSLQAWFKQYAIFKQPETKDEGFSVNGIKPDFGTPKKFDWLELMYNISKSYGQDYTMLFNKPAVRAFKIIEFRQNEIEKEIEAIRKQQQQLKASR